MDYNTRRGVKSIARRASERTSYAIRKEWDKENHKIYSVRFRLKEEAEIIEYIESHKAEKGTSNIFREALEMYIKRGQD